MPPSNPLIDPATGSIDFERLYYEARPIAQLTALLAGVALLPTVAAIVLRGNSLAGFLSTVLTQFVLAVGAGVVLLYVISRGIQLAEESPRDDADE